MKLLDACADRWRTFVGRNLCNALSPHHEMSQDGQAGRIKPFATTTLDGLIAQFSSQHGRDAMQLDAFPECAQINQDKSTCKAGSASAKMIHFFFDASDKVL